MPDQGSAGEAGTSWQKGEEGGWVEVGGEMESKYRQMSAAAALTAARQQSTAAHGTRTWALLSLNGHREIKNITFGAVEREIMRFATSQVVG